MSGTSCDGVDAALVRVSRGRSAPRVRLERALTAVYPRALRAELLEVAAGRALAPADLGRLSVRVGERFAAAALRLLREAGVPPGEVDAVASHGQTVAHRPGRPTVTVQIGAPAVIAERCGVTVVADFRAADAAAGGEGAPLVPLVHALLFAHPRRERAIVNVGGIANATILRPGTAEPLASDTGPGNAVIDACCELLGRGRMDRGGRLAERGRVDRGLAGIVLASPFFRRRLPASTGREDFGRPLAERVVAEARRRRLDDAAVVASVTWATAHAIVRSCRALAGSVPGELYLCGGGALNPALRRMLAAEAPGVRVGTTAELGLDPRFVEAVAFAVLGWLALEGRPGNVPGVTGARGPRVLGTIVPGRNYRGVRLA